MDVEQALREAYRAGQYAAAADEGLRGTAEPAESEDEAVGRLADVATGDPLAARIRRIEYILVRLATTAPDALPKDAHELIADIVREFDQDAETNQPE